MTDIFLDTADLLQIEKLIEDPRISGLTTNPTLMRQAGVTNYMSYVCDLIDLLREKKQNGSVSLEVVSDEPNTMMDEAMILHEIGEELKYKVYVKIPIVNTQGFYNSQLIDSLLMKKVAVNVTAIMTDEQARTLLLDVGAYPSQDLILSVFAGRIADTGRDPLETIAALRLVPGNYKSLWASPREVYNYYQARDWYVDIITMAPDLIKKLDLEDKNLYDYSVDTVKMFVSDAKKSGFTINDV